MIRHLVWGLRMACAVATIYLVAVRHTVQSQTHRQIL